MNWLRVSYVQHCPGHIDSYGDKAEWCIKDHKTHEILQSYSNKEDAEKALKRMQYFKHKASYVRYAGQRVYFLMPNGELKFVRDDDDTKNWQEHIDWIEKNKPLLNQFGIRVPKNINDLTTDEVKSLQDRLTDKGLIPVYIAGDGSIMTILPEGKDVSNLFIDFVLKQKPSEIALVTHDDIEEYNYDQFIEQFA